MKIASLLAEVRVVEIPFDFEPEPETPPAAPPVAAPKTKPVAPKATAVTAPQPAAMPVTTRPADAQVPAAQDDHTARAMSRLQDLMHNVPDDDEPPVELEPRGEPETAGALVRVGEVNPQWTRLGDMPMYILGPIRRLAKDLFAQYTDTPLEQIEVVGNFGGNGPNTDAEINSVSQWVLDHGQLESSDDVDFGQSMPGYSAQTRLFTTGERDFLLVKDDHGKYVYSWSTAPALSQDKAQELLKR